MNQAQETTWSWTRGGRILKLLGMFKRGWKLLRSELKLPRTLPKLPRTRSRKQRRAARFIVGARARGAERTKTARAILCDKRNNLKRGFEPIDRRAYVRRCNARVGAPERRGDRLGEGEGDNSTGMSEGVGVAGGCAARGGGGGGERLTCTSDRRILKVAQASGVAGGVRGETEYRADTVVNRYSCRRSLRLAGDGVGTHVGMQLPWPPAPSSTTPFSRRGFHPLAPRRSPRRARTRSTLEKCNVSTEVIVPTALEAIKGSLPWERLRRLSPLEI